MAHSVKTDEGFIRRVASVRVIVETYVSRLSSLWALHSSKWRWNLALYDNFFRIAVAMTNADIKAHPLRASDGENFRRMRNRQTQIATEAANKHRQTVLRY